MLICICGDSYFSLDVFHLKTHWSELLNLDNNVKIKNLSITGASNLNIRQQIKYAVDYLNADKIIFTATNHNRLDFRKDVISYYHNQNCKQINTSSFNNSKTYEKFWNPNKEWLFFEDNNWTYRSTTLMTIQKENEKFSSSEFQKNFNDFFNLFRDDFIECEKDYCIIQQTINEYNETILFFDPRYFAKFGYKFNIEQNKLINLTDRFEFNYNTMYHTTVEEQKILAEEIKVKLKNLYNIY